MPEYIVQNSRPGYTTSVNGQRVEAPTSTAKQIPAGGSPGSVLVKMSAADYDYQWMDIDELINAIRNPETGQFLLNEDGSILFKPPQS